MIVQAPPAGVEGDGPLVDDGLAGILDAGGRWEEEGQRDRQLHVSENKLHAPTGTLQLSLPTINLYYGH